MAQEAISKIHKSIIESGKKPAFIPFVEVGYPDMEFSKELFYLFQQNGAAAIEVGIPFSDPLADGPIIQNASKIALQNGVNLQKTFDLLGEIKQDMSVPLILFSYLNPVLSFGTDNFVRELKDKNVAGVIIPDLPLEEAEELSITLKENNIDLIFLVSPTSDNERIKNISKKSSGFIYLVSSTGVTGVRESFSTMLAGICKKIKTVVALPVAVGFGVSKPEHIKNLKEIKVDGAIIASSFIKIIDQYSENRLLALKKLDEYIKMLYQ
ncbi:MAG TPA: tryptophan synthase subunit alpha [Candidatus Gastranaerophilales bacterium]|nr:tryptophan synthase subunit alpha [Candidatus Gastranaerophilales bacterium]